jgi:hypothetical protein
MMLGELKMTSDISHIFFFLKIFKGDTQLVFSRLSLYLQAPSGHRLQRGKWDWLFEEVRTVLSGLNGCSNG